MEIYSYYPCQSRTIWFQLCAGVLFARGEDCSQYLPLFLSPSNAFILDTRTIQRSWRG